MLGTAIAPSGGLAAVRVTAEVAGAGRADRQHNDRMRGVAASGAGIDWVVFDLGGVLLEPTRAVPALAARLGAPAEEFVTAYYAHRPDYDLFSDAMAYWSAVADSCGADRPDVALAAELVTLDNQGWSVANPRMLRLIGRLRTATRLAVLSNAPASMGELVRGLPWAAAFEHVVISGELGMVKPDPAIYQALLRTVGGPAERVAFIDDRADNVAAAAARGIQAFCFTGEATLRAWLIERGLPLDDISATAR